MGSASPAQKGLPGDHERMSNSLGRPLEVLLDFTFPVVPDPSQAAPRGLGRAGRGQVSHSEGMAGSTDVGDR